MASINHIFNVSSVIPNFVAVDTESTDLHPWRGAKLISAAAAFPSGEEMFWRDSDLYGGGLRRLLNDETIDKVFHNAKHDARILQSAGFKIRGQVWDTMIFAHLLDGRNAGKGLGLGACAVRFLPSDKRKIVDEITKYFDDHNIGEDRRWMSFALLPPDLLKRRNVGDACLTRDIFLRTYKTVALTFPWLLKNEHRLIPVVIKMENRGIVINEEELDAQVDYFNDIYEDCLRFYEGVTGNNSFNIDSPDDQAHLLGTAGLLELIPELTKGGKSGKNKKPKMDDWNLRQLHHPVSHMLILGKAAKKMRDTFLIGMLQRSINGVVHANANQLGTNTGRFSYSDPNLQNIPIEGDRRTSYTEDEAREAYEMTEVNYAPHLKRIFYVRPGFAHIHSDKKQAEMFMMGHYANDPKMDAIFAESLRTGKSIHDMICIAMYGEWTKGLKTRTKQVVFGYQYGSGVKTFSKRTGLPMSETLATRARLARTLPGLPRWKRQLDEIVQERGFVITEHGRRHYIRSDASYVAINRMCQGSVADEIKSRMVALNDYFESEIPEATVLLNIHDDLANEVPQEYRHKAAKDIKEIMEETGVPFRLPLPSSLDITYSRWSDLKEIEDGKPFPEPAAQFVDRNRPVHKRIRLGTDDDASKLAGGFKIPT